MLHCSWAWGRGLNWFLKNQAQSRPWRGTYPVTDDLKTAVQEGFCTRPAGHFVFVVRRNITNIVWSVLYEFPLPRPALVSHFFCFVFLLYLNSWIHSPKLPPFISSFCYIWSCNKCCVLWSATIFPSHKPDGNQFWLLFVQQCEIWTPGVLMFVSPPPLSTSLYNYAIWKCLGNN